LFISDLHLTSEQPAILDCLLDFLGDRARGADALYILGDLFDVWIGDDAITAADQRVIAGLRQLGAAGTRCYLMRGNRDFLLGRRFARESHCELLPDPYLTHIAGQPTLLMHGDLLCTDDLAYQRFRRRARNPILRALFLLQSRQRRRRIAENYRRRSRAATANKEAVIMDANPLTVGAYLHRYDATRLIHGHTHRPTDQHITLNGRPCVRQVLADWRIAEGKVEAEVLVEEQGRWWREPLRDPRAARMIAAAKLPADATMAPL
jgi:UDP-2,3-diacylglucosamine hydrolase